MLCDLLRIIRFFMKRCAEKRGGVTRNRGLAFTGKFQKRHFAVIQSWRADCECDAQHCIWQKNHP